MSAALSRLAQPRIVGSVLVALLAAGLAAVACAPASNAPTFAVQQQGQVTVQVVDALYDGGRGSHIVLNSSGSPVVSYLLYSPVLKSGQIPPAITPGRTHPPAVAVATYQKRIWSLGSVPPQSPVGSTTGLNPEIANKDGQSVPGVNTAIALDSSGHEFVVWATPSGVYYGDDSSGSFPSKPDQVATGQTTGVSIAVAGDGVPWVSWYGGGSLNVARKSVSGDWTTEAVDTFSLTSTTARTTSIVTDKNDQPVVAYGNGDSTVVASRNGGNWSKDTVSGSGGYATSLALDGQGNPVVSSYDAQGGIHVASKSSGSWQVANVDTTSASPAAMAAWGTGVGVDGSGKVYVAYAEATSQLIKLATGTGTSFASHVVPSSTSGQTPSLAVTKDGKVYVSFFSANDADLDVAVPSSPSLSLAHPATTLQQPSIPPQTATSGGPPPCSPSGTSLTISAQNIAFDVNCLAAPANTAFTLTFDNKDAVPHNVEIYTQNPTSGGTRLGGATGISDTVTGATATYDVSALKAGTYYFQCDIHPTQMFGTFVVAAAK